MSGLWVHHSPPSQTEQRRALQRCWGDAATVSGFNITRRKPRHNCGTFCAPPFGSIHEERNTSNTTCRASFLARKRWIGELLCFAIRFGECGQSNIEKRIQTFGAQKFPKYTALDRVLLRRGVRSKLGWARIIASIARTECNKVTHLVLSVRVGHTTYRSSDTTTCSRFPAELCFRHNAIGILSGQ